MKFEIVKVKAGWFVFRLDLAEVWATGIWGHDSPALLLKLLARSLTGQEGCVTFDGEPECWTLTIRGGEVPTLELRQEDETMLREVGIDLFPLAKDVVVAFEAIDREDYAREWMPFPAAELLELKHTLGDYSENN